MFNLKYYTMPKFGVSFISNVYQNHDDPSDFKEWSEFDGESKSDVINEVSQWATVLRVWPID